MFPRNVKTKVCPDVFFAFLLCKKWEIHSKKEKRNIRGAKGLPVSALPRSLDDDESMLWRAWSHPLPASRTLYGGLQLGWSWNTCVEVLAPFTLWQDETLTCTVQSCPEGLTVSDLIKHKHCLHIAPCGRERQTFSCSMVKSTQRVQKYKQQEQDYWIPRTEYLLISEVPGIYSRTSSWKKTSNLLPQSCRNFNDPALDSLWFWKALNFSDGLR